MPTLAVGALVLAAVIVVDILETGPTPGGSRMARTRTTPSEKAEARETKRQQRRFTRQARSDAKDAQRAEAKAALKDIEQLRQDLYAGKYAAGSPPPLPPRTHSSS